MSVIQSPFFNIQYGWSTGDSGWGDPVNTNLKVLSFLDKRAVDSIVSTLPSTPVIGSSYILTTDNLLYVRFAEGWVFITPQEGMSVYVLSLSAEYRFLSSVWNAVPPKVLASDLSSPTGSSLVGYKNAATGSVSATVKSKLDSTVFVGADFGAVGDGTTDDTGALQAAFSSGAKRVEGAAGKTYRITNTLTLDASNIELDFHNSTILLDDSSGTKDLLFVGNGTTQRSNVKIKNITFSRNQIASAGYAINSNLIGVVEISGCRVFGNNTFWRGIRIYRGVIVNILNNYIDNCIDRGIYLLGGGTGSNRTLDTSIVGNRVEGGVTCVETSDFVEGFYCRNNIFFNTTSSAVVLSATIKANALVSFKLQQNDFDTTGANGLFIDNVTNIQVTGCWFSSNSAASINLGSSCSSVVISANQIYPTVQALSVAGTSVIFDSNLVSGGTVCVAPQSTATNIQITNNSIGNAQTAINLANNPTNTVVSNNLLYTMSVGYINGSGGTGCVIRNNKGDTFLGVSSISVTASPFTYTAGARPEQVSIFSGTVSNISVSGTTVASSTNCSVHLSPYQSMVVTYSVAPTMTKNVL